MIAHRWNRPTRGFTKQELARIAEYNQFLRNQSINQVIELSAILGNDMYRRYYSWIGDYQNLRQVVLSLGELTTEEETYIKDKLMFIRMCKPKYFKIC